MNNHFFPIIVNKKLPDTGINDKFFLFLFRATRIPPHIGLIFKNKVYDITLVGPNLGTDAAAFITTVKKKYTKTLFLELNNPYFSATEIEDILLEAMKKYNNVTEENSCLSPIKTAFHLLFDIQMENVNYIFDLIPLLHQNNIIQQTFHLNLDRNLKENTFYLQTYNKTDIQHSIIALNKVNGIC
ncbi:MAG: hypothetical protein RQ875_13885 [Vicingaceae bacterium]|nr:hypothetical protein [Vicingaceae bacterium]